MSNHKTTKYYVPEDSGRPLWTALAIFITMVGAATTIQQSTDFISKEGGWGKWMLTAGVIYLIVIMYRWWGDAIKESLDGQHSAQMDTSYRMGMQWFIFSEVMFFAAFFGALFYVRLLVLPWISGEGSGAMTHELIWPTFQNLWPLELTPDGRTTNAMGAWGLPAINTALLLASSITLTISHHALLESQRRKTKIYLGLTILLGLIFLYMQGQEYIHAYHTDLTLDAGIYGSTFFLLTGFHGMHVTIGTIFLIVVFIRMILKNNDQTVENHFSFESAAWYWHFVDVVWLFLFLFVYVF